MKLRTLWACAPALFCAAPALATAYVDVDANGTQRDVRTIDAAAASVDGAFPGCDCAVGSAAAADAATGQTDGHVNASQSAAAYADGGYLTSEAQSGTTTRILFAFADPAQASATIQLRFAFTGTIMSDFLAHADLTGSVTGAGPRQSFYQSYNVVPDDGTPLPPGYAPSGTPLPFDYSVDFSFVVRPTTALTVDLAQDIYTFSNLAGGGDARSAFSVIVPDGVSYQLIPLAAPEPASWAMMLAGFAGVGGALRRRTRGAAFV